MPISGRVIIRGENNIFTEVIVFT